MYKIQCDKNLISILSKVFSSLKINAEIKDFENEKNDISIIRSADNFTTNADYLIINSDDKSLMKKIKASKGKIITCGLSNRSTVTFSSLSEREAVMCVQRSFISSAEEKISPFELPFELCGKCFDEVSILMIMTAALLCGAEPSQLRKIYL